MFTTRQGNTHFKGDNHSVKREQSQTYIFALKFLPTEIASTMSQALHFNTYGGNPLSCAVGSAVLEVW